MPDPVDKDRILATPEVATTKLTPPVEALDARSPAERAARLSRSERASILTTLEAVAFGKDLNAKEASEFFKTLGIFLSPLGFGLRAAQILKLPQNDHDLRILTEKMYHGLLYSLVEKVREEQSERNLKDTATLRQTQELLASVPSAARMRFYRGLFILILQGAGEQEFLMAQVPQVLYFANIDEKRDAFNMARSLPAEKNKTDLLEMIVRSAKDFPEVERIVGSLKSGRGELLQHQIFREFSAWSKYGAAFRELRPSLGSLNLSKALENWELTLSAARASLARTKSAAMVAKKRGLRDPVNTSCAKALRAIVDSRLQEVRHFRQRRTSEDEKRDFLKLARSQAAFEFKYGLKLESEVSELDGDERSFRIAEIDELSKIFQRLDEGVILLTTTLHSIRRVHRCVPATDQNGTLRDADYDPNTGVISVADSAQEHHARKSFPNFKGLCINVTHELAHALQLGPNERTEVKLSRSRAISDLVNEEVYKKPSERNISRIEGALLCSRRPEELSEAIEKVGMERLLELENFDINAVVAAASVYKQGKEISFPDKYLGKMSQMPKIKACKTAFSEALEEYSELLISDPILRETPNVKAKLERLIELKSMLELPPAEPSLQPKRIQHKLRRLSEIDHMNCLIRVVAIEQEFSVTFGDISKATPDMLRKFESVLRTVAPHAWYARGTVRVEAEDDSFVLRAERGELPVIELKVALHGASLAKIKEDQGERLAEFFQKAFKRDREILKRLEVSGEPIVGPSDPRVDFEGFMRILNWGQIPRDRYRLITPGSGYMIDGQVQQDFVPFLYEGRWVIGSYDEDEQVLFCFDAREREKFKEMVTSRYARYSPWEAYAESFKYYLLAPRVMLEHAPETFDHFEAHFRVWSRRDPDLIKKLDRQLEVAARFKFEQRT